MPAPKDPIKYREFIEKQRKKSKGRKHSEETKIKISLGNIGKKRSPETCKRIGLAKKGNKNMLGKKQSQEVKEKISAQRKGRKLSEPWKQKISESLCGEKNPFYGRKHSEETKRKISEKKKGRNISIEQRLKISLSLKGRPSPNKGKKASIESCKKRSRPLERNPNWKGGISFEPYCPKFNKEFKERVRAFFGNRCVECGAQTEYQLHVHHVNFRKDSCCNKNILPIFVPLCRSCHSKTQFDRAFWEDWYVEIINQFYNGQCYLKKEDI